MTSVEIYIATSLYTRVVFLPGSWDKRFAKAMYTKAITTPAKEITINQREWLFRLCYKYRKQISQVYEQYRHVPECSRKGMMKK